MSILVKSKISLEQFKTMWYYEMYIEPDTIEDSKLKDMYTAYLASSLDTHEAEQAIEEYIGERSIIHEAGDAYVNDESNERRSGLPN